MNYLIPVGFRKILQHEVVETAHKKKKFIEVSIFPVEMLVMSYVVTFSLHVFMPFVLCTFCTWHGLFVYRWWLEEFWYAPDFLSKCCTLVTVVAARLHKGQKLTQLQVAKVHWYMYAATGVRGASAWPSACPFWILLENKLSSSNSTW